LFDLLRDDPTGTDFRNNIGINYLKYGAAYTPWLKVSLPKNITYDSIRTSGIIKKNSSTGPAVTLKSLTSDATMQEFIQDYDDIFANETTISGNITATFAPDTTLRGAYNTKVAAYSNAAPDTLHDIFGVIYAALDLVDNWTTLSSTPLADAYKKQITATFNGFWQTLVSYEKAAEVAVTGITGYDEAYDDVTMSGTGGFAATGGIAAASAASVFGAAATDALKLDAMKAKLAAMFEQINTAFNQTLDTLDNQKLSFESSLLDSFSIYKAIIKGLEDAATEMPPSGAVAGVYAATDRDRGVWKAPANVSLASVVAPTNTFTASQLDALNIDVNAGKSINAIRSFTGKGTLIWGARTLAGNDNEWRYIPVRRFYNMVEESIKKSTYWAVFEPNSANTWVKVKGMIDNYLTNKWKDGALVGAKPDDAFFVKIGLGTTMSAQDILEGRMHVEIGMAVVRPAEFIILKFSHLLQKS
ncbi:MAG: phage tail sheath subtilisin-like domain-containing protein, partial [Bacteroidota bacterium]|nr:phage tail sheath subtilisin-like domain-containing protein [Bacteroidota bacterium]